MQTQSGRKALVLGGGLAGMAASLRLRSAGWQVELWESRSRLGGRAGSFVDQSTGHTVDYCQHVGMGCCTHLLSFLEETQTLQAWRRHATLHFFGPTGKHVPLRASPILPAPLHLQKLLWGWPGLTLKQRIEVARAIYRLMRLKPTVELESKPALEFLVQARQSAGTMERFWSTIMVSALGESLENVALGPMRKVIVEGFLASRSAYEVWIPQQPLRTLFGEQAAQHLSCCGVEIHTQRSVRRLLFEAGVCVGATASNQMTSRADVVVIALPWFHLHSLVESETPASVQAMFDIAGELKASPITGVHLWWDQAWLEQPHAAIVGRLPQWVFRSPWLEDEGDSLAWEPCAGKSHHYQVVISASRELPRDANKLVEMVVKELHELFPKSRQAKLLRWKVVTDPHSVFSVSPDSAGRRPNVDALLKLHHLALAGDWTVTGWPATMEGAIRSGNWAAKACCELVGISPPHLPIDLPYSWLAKRLIQRNDRLTRMPRG
jgi:squalene-associated FAD-dependent desaturase